MLEQGTDESSSIEMTAKQQVRTSTDRVPVDEAPTRELLYNSHKITLDSSNYKESQNLQIKILISFICLLNVGMAEQTTGVLIRYLMDYYDVDHSIVSFIFLVQFMGFFLAASLNDLMHKTFGLRGTVVSAQLACLVCFGVCSFAPPLPVFICFYLLNGYSTGCQNSTFNTWGGKLEYHNQIMGLLHSAYGIGSIISPILATHLLERKGGNWRQWYYILTANAVVLALLSYFGFKDETKWKHLYTLEQSNDSDKKGSILETLKQKLVWFFSFILFLYVGGEVTLGNWVYNYLIDIKDVSAKSSSFITSGYWLFMTLGRLILGFVIGVYYEDNEAKFMVYIALVIASGSLIFTALSFFHVQVIAVLTMGFFLGPVFPTIAIIALKKLPVVLHVSGISFISSIGGAGGGIIPYVVGLVSSIASSEGGDSAEGLVWFPFITLVVFATSMVSWVVYWWKSKEVKYSEI